MHPDDRAKAVVLFVAALPVAAWLFTVRPVGDLERGGLTAVIRAAGLTVRGERPVFVAAFVGGILAAIAGVIFARRTAAAGFGGAAFRLHLRGTKVVSMRRLAWCTRERNRE